MAWRSTPKVPSTVAERPIEIEQHRALLDVQLEVSGGVRQFFAAFLHLLEIDSILLRARRGG